MIVIIMILVISMCHSPFGVSLHPFRYQDCLYHFVGIHMLKSFGNVGNLCMNFVNKGRA